MSGGMVYDSREQVPNGTWRASTEVGYFAADTPEELDAVVAAARRGGFVPGVSKTKVVPEGRRFQARYYDPAMRLWFDLGDPRDTEAEARSLIAAFHEGAA